jgi:hypothetical protein
VEKKVEPEGTQEAQSAEVRKTENGDSVIEPEVREQALERDLLEAVLDWDNMFWAQERVIANRGSAGIDGMTVEELNAHQTLSGIMRKY